MPGEDAPGGGGAAPIDFSTQYVRPGNGDGDLRVFVLAASGDLDAAAADALAAAPAPALDERSATLVVDLRDLGRLDGGGAPPQA